MGSLDDKSDKKSAGSGLEHATSSNANGSLANNALAFDGYNRFSSDKRMLSFTSCSSSISSDSSLDYPLQDVDEQDKSSSKLDNNDHLATEHDASDSGHPTLLSSPTTYYSVVEIPPTQVMERPDTSKYRIPSHVFERKKSTHDEWSTTSNESLFSLQMGGNSFCNPDSVSLKSGELGPGYASDAYISSDRLASKTTEGVKSPDGKSHDVGKGSNNQGLIIPDDIKEDRRSTADERTSHFSACSSTKSFVFPILAGETDKGNSPNPGGSLTGGSEEPTPQSPPKPAAPPAPEPPSKPEASEAKAETKKATPLISWSKWFPCFRPKPAAAAAPPPAPDPPSKPEASGAKTETKKATPLISWSKWFPCFRCRTCCS